MSEFSDYIAAKKSASPGATGESEFATYLRAKGITPPSPAVAHEAAPVPMPKPEEPGFFRRALNTIEQGAHAVKTVGGDVIDTRGAALLDPSKRHQLERGLGDVLTGGVANRIADWAGNKLGDTGAANLQQTEAADQANNPEYRTAGNIAGMVAPNPFNKLGGAVAKKVLAPVAAKASGKFAGAALGTARSVAGYEASAVPLAATQALMSGGNPITAAYEASKDPLGLMLSAAGGAVGGVGTGKAIDLRDPANLSGRTLAQIKAAGGEIRPFGEPVRGGAYETPEMKSYPLDRQGNIKFADESVNRSIGSAEKRYQAAQDAWGTKADQILADHHPDEIYQAARTHDVLDTIDAENSVNGVTGNDKIATATDKVRRMLTSETNALDAKASGAAGKPIYQTEAGGTISDIMKTRKVVNNLARHATEPADKFVYGKVLDALRRDAELIDPRIGELNAEYGKTIESLKGANDALFGQQRPAIKDTEAARAAAAGRMSRAGDPTQAGPLADNRLERFGEASPENAAEVAMMKARKAATRLRYGEPETSTSMEKGQHNAATHAIGHAVAKGIGGAIGLHAGGLPGAVAGAMIPNAVSAMFQNPLAVDLRLKLPLAEGISGITGVRSGLSALAIARDEQKRREAQRAAMAGGR